MPAPASSHRTLVPTGARSRAESPRHRPVGDRVWVRRSWKACPMSRGRVIELLSGLALVITSLATVGPAARAIGDGFGFLWPGGVVGVLVGLCLVQAFLPWRRSIMATSEPSRDRPEQGAPDPALRQTETVEHSSVARLERDPTDASAAFGKRLRELRAQRGITQEDLAREANLHPVQIGRVERGLRAPGLTTILRLARGLNVEPSELFNDDSESVASSG